MSEIVVIGGGFAGLAAGVALAAGGARPLVLEAGPQLGGRARSFTDAASGERLDNGQHAMLGCYTHTLAFLERIGTAGRVVRQDRLRVAMRDRTRGAGRIVGARLPGPLHMAGGVLGYRLLRPGERLAALRAGVAILRRHRRGDASLADCTVAELLRALGQSAAAQASFWNPVAVATLNELPERAAARPFAAVLARAFFGGRRDAQFVLPGTDLSDLYTGAAEQFIVARGGRVETRAAVTGLALGPTGVRAVRLRDGRRVAAAACIAAVPPRALAALLPDALRAAPLLRGLDTFAGSPIVSAHLWLDRPVMAEPFLGCIGTTAQWFFNRSALQARGATDGQWLSAVISAGHAIVDWPAPRIAATIFDDLRALLPDAAGATLRRAVVVKERQATISNTPATERRRPGAATPLANLWLAGDWTATGLPPTIESAVMSGHRAAALALGRGPTEEP
ncbi:hydroxysqualene dehydroxylase HpnE [bacterium]|nr:hydroxysqualene dehydroxylase HpnE [bacterium]